MKPLEISSIVYVLNALNRLSKMGAVGLAMGLLIIVAWVDWQVRSEIGLSVFYIIPIIILTWRLGLQLGLASSCVAGIIWMINEFHTFQKDSLLIVLWNTAMRLMIFALISLLLNQFQVSYQAMQDLIHKDGLTGLNNWRSFQESLAIELSRQSRYRDPMTLVFMDVDNFKQVNDQWGHPRGDALLRAIAECLATQVRTGDVVSRLGGDEFTILLPRTDQQQAQMFINRLHPHLQALAAAEQLPVGFSLGVITYAQTTPTQTEIVAIADQLMYQAKQTGKNRVVYQTF
jgi:diguanylate cyclase (GGDEF)-like protein